MPGREKMRRIVQKGLISQKAFIVSNVFSKDQKVHHHNKEIISCEISHTKKDTRIPSCYAKKKVFASFNETSSEEQHMFLKSNVSFECHFITWNHGPECMYCASRVCICSPAVVGTRSRTMFNLCGLL